MAFTPQNFGQIGYQAPTDQGFGTIFDRIISGYAGGMLPRQLEEVEKNRMFGGLGNPTGDIANAIYVAQLERKHGPDDPIVQAAKNQLQLQQQSQRTLNLSREDLMQNRSWGSLNSAAKENTLSIGRAIAPNATDIELANFYKNGGTHQELGAQMGLTPEQTQNVENQYALTNASITAQQKGRGAEAELDVLDKFVQESQAPYAQRFNGYSPKQIADSFSKDPKDIDRQARFLAGRALAGEQNAIRAVLANSSNAKGALDKLGKLSLNESKIFESLVKPEVYEKMQKYISEILKESANARFRAMGPQRQRTKQEIVTEELDDPLGRYFE